MCKWRELAYQPMHVVLLLDGIRLDCLEFEYQQSKIFVACYLPLSLSVLSPSLYFDKDENP